MNVYDDVTDTIVSALESGGTNFTLPWHRHSTGLPVNGTTRAMYQGINVLQLWASATIKEFPSNEWASYRQWQTAGRQVRKGEKGSIVVFYKELPREEDEEKRVVLRHSRVFNESQLEDFEPAETPEQVPLERLEAADLAVRCTGITVKEHGESACYIPTLDEVHIPDSWRFFDTETSSRQEAFYATLFHELTHATGHKSRLDRDLTGRFGDPSYAFEELIAELGAAFCCARLGISAEPRADHAGYIKSWLKGMKEDNRAIFKAAAHAQKATEWLL